MPSLIPGNVLKITVLALLLLSNAVVAQTTSSSTAKTAQAETFAIPNAIQNFDQLFAFVEKIDSLEPTGKSEQEMIAHQRKVARSVVAATKKLSSKEINEEDAMECVFLKMQALRILQELDEPEADEQLSQAIEIALGDKREKVQRVGTKFLIERGFSQWAVWDKEERGALVDRIIKGIIDHPPTAYQVDLVMKVVDFLGDESGGPFARELLAKAVPHFQGSSDPQIQGVVTILQGIERRMNLLGNDIKLTGTLLDGTELDWSSYRGKVVLVDFWATWCGPCRAEVPNVLKMYHAYHDKGFEVLGISLDERREQAEAYIKQTNIPWATLFSSDPAQRGWRAPMAVRYGISGIPRAILVDREGKVVHMLARGENLVQELRRLLGEPIARSQQQSDTYVQQATVLSAEE